MSEMNSAVETAHRLKLTVAGRPESTDILLGPGVLSEAPALLAPYRGGRLLLVADEGVRPLYAEPLRDALREAGFAATLAAVPAGEESKTLETLSRLYAEAHAAGLDRSDAVVAVGGGMVGDVAGMLAGTYMRGLALVQVPTSLVAMVTASVGGKVGVNFDAHKNLVGLFKQPSHVLADTDTLRTLPATEYLSGLGELVNVGVLGAPEVFESLERDGAARLHTLVAAAIRCKCDIVEADPFDRLGVRARLNLGHTFGHAFETLSGFTLAHGLAVSVGLHVAARVAAELGLCDASLPARVRRTLEALDLPVSLKGYRAGDVMAAMRHDKKRSGGRLRWVLPTAVGEVRIVGEEDVPPGLVERVLDELVDRGEGL
ncbi:MAG TPA: 3-dehydroquinate synthase [Pyrinomonadaceae bacterium]|jgi:3-dehydroquinate synthase